MNVNWQDYLIADFESGTLTWKERPRELFPAKRHWTTWNIRNAGKLAGSLGRMGYWTVYVFGKPYRAHRILWEMANGPIPKGLQIDHRDRNRGNNILSNLRLATKSENARNTCMHSDNASGVKGVTWAKDRSKWNAQITYQRRKIYIGHFITKEEAANAYSEAAIKYHGEFAPTTKQTTQTT